MSVRLRAVEYYSHGKMEIIGLNRFYLVLFLILVMVDFASAQNTVSKVPDRFGKIVLGMSIKDAKKELQADGNFNFRGNQDLSILRRPNESLIECRGYDFIDRAFFQFKDNMLYSITILFNQDLIDHYSLYTTLTGKYGDPDELDPERSIWRSEKNTLVLERPLQIKYLDRKIFEGITNDSKISKSLSELSRDQFLDQF